MSLRFFISILFMLFFSVSFSSFGQETENQVSLEIADLIKSHKESIIKLYNYRGAPLDWIETGNVDENYLSRSFFSMYRKKVGILTYTYQDSTLYVHLFFGSRRNSFQKERSFKVDKDELQEAVNDVNRLFSSQFLHRAPKHRGSSGRDISARNTDPEKAFEFLNSMLLPADLELEEFDHLVIVPTFNISTLPFAAFQVNGEDLIERMSYSIAPNLFELAVSNEQNKNKNNDNYRSMYFFWENALFVSNPEYPDNLEWDFPDLPGAKKEINEVIQISKPANYVKFDGKKAIKDSIIQDFCDYDLIYFATHGISNSESPMDNSFLVLADNETEKSYLSLREIMNTRNSCKLKADLVVLSACQTGLGRSHEGGIIGLARAFQIAGANHVLMSLWNIDDQETSTLMSLFFRELSEARELMPHEALRQAILKYKNEINDDPKYWAAFSIFGVPY